MRDKIILMIPRASLYLLSPHLSKRSGFHSRFCHIRRSCWASCPSSFGLDIQCGCEGVSSGRRIGRLYNRSMNAPPFASSWTLQLQLKISYKQNTPSAPTLKSPSNFRQNAALQPSDHSCYRCCYYSSGNRSWPQSVPRKIRWWSLCDCGMYPFPKYLPNQSTIELIRLIIFTSHRKCQPQNLPKKGK